MNQGEATGPDLYAVLGLTPEASAQEIRGAYQRLSGDIAAGQAPAVQRQAIEVAYETLGDPIRRLRYDAQAAAPAPSRLQLPSFSLPGVRVPVRAVRITGLRRPNLPRVDPVLAAAILLVGIVGLAVIFLPMLRGHDNNAPAQSVADLVTSPTPGTTPFPGPQAAGPGARSPILGAGPNGLGQPGGTSTLLPPISANAPQVSGNPLQGGPPPGGLFPPQGQSAPVAGAGYPPFLTGSSIIDMLRAVAAASAVRNGAPPASVNGLSPIVSLPGGPPSSNLLQPNGAPGGNQPPLGAPAGIPITSLGPLPAVASSGQPPASQPVSAGVASLAPAASQFTAVPQPTPAPTPTRSPNHITVPGTGSGASNLAPLGATRVPAAATTSPNRFGPPATVAH
jgi:DnaJ domain